MKRVLPLIMVLAGLSAHAADTTYSVDTMLKTRSVANGMPFTSGPAIDTRVTVQPAAHGTSLGTIQAIEFGDLRDHRAVEHDLVYTSPDLKVGYASVNALVAQYSTKLVPHQQEVGIGVTRSVNDIFKFNAYVGHMPTKGWGHGEILTASILNESKLGKTTINSALTARALTNYLNLGNGYLGTEFSATAERPVSKHLSLQAQLGIPLSVSSKMRDVAYRHAYAGIGVKASF